MSDLVCCSFGGSFPEYTCIEYPSRNIRNADEAIANLGGQKVIEDIVNKRKTEGNNNSVNKHFLELHFNREGMFDHPIFGKMNAVKNCILLKKTTRIKKARTRKRKREPNSNISGNSNEMREEVKIEVCGKISTVVTFDGLADFQVFSDAKDMENEKKRKKHSLWSLDTSNYNPLVPNAFACRDQPYLQLMKKLEMKNVSNEDNILFGVRERGSKRRKINPENQTTNVMKKQLGNYNKKKKKKLTINPIDIRFDSELIPLCPPLNSKYRISWDLFEKYLADGIFGVGVGDEIRMNLFSQLNNYFKVKPIWTKYELLLQPFYIPWEMIKKYSFNVNFAVDAQVIESIVMKHCKRLQMDEFNCEMKIYLNMNEKKKLICGLLFPVISYRFIDGPFRNALIRYGFDPRLSKNAMICRHLQCIDFRINKKHANKLGIIEQYQMCGNRPQKRGKPEIRPIPNASYSNISQSTDEIQTEYKVLAYILPPKRMQFQYQLGNIADEEIKKVINNSTVNAQCNKMNGWLNIQDLNQIRTLMKHKIKEWIKERNNKKSDEKNSADSEEDDYFQIF